MLAKGGLQIHGTGNASLAALLGRAFGRQTSSIDEQFVGDDLAQSIEVGPYAGAQRGVEGGQLWGEGVLEPEGDGDGSLEAQLTGQGRAGVAAVSEDTEVEGRQGNATCSLVDSVTEWNRGFDSLMPWLQGLPPFANLDEYRKDSPLYNAGRVTTPLLSFHGEADFLPVTQMENYHLQLVNREVPAKLLKFVGVGHGMYDTLDGLEALGPAYELYGAQEQILWFQEHLK